jgi:hypothetical protein
MEPASERPATRRDCYNVIALAVSSLIVLAGVEAVRRSPSPFAPRVNVRWAEGVSDDDRLALERQFELLEGARQDGRTWAYDAGNPAPAALRALIAHPAVEDTHHIDRRSGVVTPEAPRGTTWLRRDWIALWRDSLTLEWLARLSLVSALVSIAWLASTGRLAWRRSRQSPPEGHTATRETFRRKPASS